MVCDPGYGNGVGWSIVGEGLGSELRGHDRQDRAVSNAIVETEATFGKIGRARRAVGSHLRTHVYAED